MMPYLANTTCVAVRNFGQFTLRKDCRALCDLGHIAYLHELRKIRDGHLVNGSSGNKMVVIRILCFSQLLRGSREGAEAVSLRWSLLFLLYGLMSGPG